MGKVVFDDVIEMHSTIKTIEERQQKLVKLAQKFLSEAEYLGGMIDTLKSEYNTLKEKAKN